MRRHLLTDGMNSIWHVLSGILTKWCLWVAPTFIIYEILDHDDVNLSVDLAEYMIGLMAALSFTTQSWILSILSLAVTLAFFSHFSDTVRTNEKTWAQILFNK